MVAIHRLRQTPLKTMMKRLNKYLAECGVDSRRKCDLIIKSGRVSVNRKNVDQPGIIINEINDVVTIDGDPISRSEDLFYVLLNKPRGYVTTVRDELNRKTVMDLIPINARIFPVGRLDKNTTGTLLLTNDGDLAYRLTHPRFEIEKTYQALLFKQIDEKDLKKIQTGIMLEDGMARADRVKVVGMRARKVELTIKEGRKREVRRMFEALGYWVKQLHRTKFAFLEVSDLEPGQWRRLSKPEVLKLKLLLNRDR